MRQLFTIPALVLGGALLLAGCGGGGDAPTGPTPEEIAQAEAEAEAKRLQDAADAAVTAATAAADALTASSEIEDVEAAEGLIMAAKDAIAKLPEAAQEVANASLAYAENLTSARRQAIEANQELTDRDQAAQMELERLRTAAQMAIAGANTAAQALDETSTDAEVMAAEMAIMAAKTAIADLPMSERDAMTAMLADAERDTNRERRRLTAAAEAEEERREQEDALRLAAAIAQAAKLHEGIAAQNGATATVAAGTGLSEGERAAAYNDAGVPSTTTPATTADTRIMVGIGTANPVALTEDKEAMVAALRGWEGKRYTAEPNGGGMYEAVVFSNVGMPTEGKKFGSVLPVPDNGSGDYQYQLTDGELAITGNTLVATRILSSLFDQGAGNKKFPLGDNARRVPISGSYHGVSGTYYCEPTDGNTCAVQVAASGFTLGGTANADNAFTNAGGTWHFKPSNPEARIMSVPDANYASYGAWRHTTEDGDSVLASAFLDAKGSGERAASGLNTLNGNAKYEGGAAGLYALSSTTGGENESGNFIADATLYADFTDNSVTGMIDNFKVGDDEMTRKWSVELKEGAIAATGGITVAGDNDDTVWTIDGDAASASGNWSGTFYDNDDGGVPQVATGTFYSEYGRDGKMVGAFGANKGANQQ